MNDLYPHMFTYGGPQPFMWIQPLMLTPAAYARLKQRPTRARWQATAVL